MKIIEALKEIPLIEKKIKKNNEDVLRYSATVDNGTPILYFTTLEEQKQKVLSTVQSTKDLVSRRAALRRALALTNAKTEVTIMGLTKTITEWIEYRQFGLTKLKDTFGYIDQSNINARNAASKTPIPDATVGIKVVALYPEEQKNEEMSFLLDLGNSIDTTLEITNATTDLVEV